MTAIAVSIIDTDTVLLALAIVLLACLLGLVYLTLRSICRVFFEQGQARSALDSSAESALTRVVGGSHVKPVPRGPA